VANLRAFGFTHVGLTKAKKKVKCPISIGVFFQIRGMVEDAHDCARKKKQFFNAKA
jgi:hypothetical protein